MSTLINVCLVAVGLVNLGPVLGMLSAPKMEQAYSISLARKKKCGRFSPQAPSPALSLGIPYEAVGFAGVAPACGPQRPKVPAERPAC